MPILDMIKVHTPRLAVVQRGFSTEHRVFTNDELQTVDRRYAHCTMATLGAIYDRDGDLIEISQRDGGRQGDLVVGLDPPSVDRREVLRDRTLLRGRTLFLGHYMNMYGHFLTETMARFWGLETGPFDHYAFFPFVYRGGHVVSYDFHRVFLQHFGIPAEQVVILRSPVEFEEIHVPEQLCTITYIANIDLPRVYRDMARQYRPQAGADRIFLSRHQPYERISNVADVEEVFRELDFKIIYPETLDLHSQIEHYASCRVMAGFAGSALHNCLFSQQGAALIELGDIRSSVRPLWTQRVVNQASGVEAHYIPYRGSPEGVVDIDNLRRALLEVSLLGRKGHQPESGIDFQWRSFANHYLWPATLTAHVSQVGDVTRVGSLLVAEPGEARLTIEGLSIALDDNAPFGIEYRILPHKGAWTAWSGPGTFLGSRGMRQPIRGYAVRLTGPDAARFRCVCLGKFAGQTALVEAVDGAECASPDHALLTGLQIQLRRAADSHGAAAENEMAGSAQTVGQRQHLLDQRARARDGR